VNDPKRLREGGGPDELRTLLIAAESDVLDDAAKERVRAGVTAAIAVGAPGSLDSMAKMTTTSKSIVLAFVAAAIGLGTYAYLKSPPSRAVSAPPATSVVSSAPSASASSDPPPAVAPTETPAPLPEIADAGPSTPKPSAKASTAPPPSPREGLLLLQARQALDKDPARALALIRQHEREFPNSQLAPERAKLLEAVLARKGD